MNVTVACVAIGGWYPRGGARLVNEFAQHAPHVKIQAWINCYPPGAPGPVIENGYDYGPYCAKPFALSHAYLSGADIGILIDAAFFPIRRIQPLVDHIAQTGYFFCKNGYKAGEWASDRCLERMGMSRSDSLTVEEISSYCVGINFADGRAVELVQRWCGFAADRLTFAGPHTNAGHQGRNIGFCSEDRRVKGHRHDQTALSIIAHRMGLQELVERPRFTTYLGSETRETVLVNQGLG